MPTRTLRIPSPAATIAGSILGLLIAGSATAQTPLTEALYVRQVEAGSLEGRVAEAEAAAGRASAAGAGRWPNPTLEWQREKATSGSASRASQDIVNVSIPLVLSGRLGLEAEAANRGARASEATLARARGELRHAAVRAFSAALAAQERRLIMEESLSSLRHLAEVIVVREQAGDAAGYDRLRIEIEAAAVEDGLSGAVLDEHHARAQALSLLGPGTQSLPHLQGPLAPERVLPSSEQLLAQLESRRADVRALELEAQGAQAAREAATRGWVPDPTVNAGGQLINVGQPGAGGGYVVGLALPLPLFDRRQGQEAQARARLQLAEARRAALIHAARTRLTAVLEDVEGQRARRTRQREGVLARAEELRRIAQAAYQGGGADLLVLVDAERTAREARLTAVALSLAVAEAEADLFLLSGAWDGAAPRSAQP
ncbi:TolC family protein [Myxococcus sp. CA040A]|uniref:TolC family protein n=1 Tax=Myxococcus sp. CA040A TaxID=2741738 RepID=UPI00157A7249|nr:TolC family protein [Myxococcus sp. CA040A]NTX04690.1 TolC family protein [Myxococcus sp. CA040A]